MGEGGGAVATLMSLPPLFALIGGPIEHRYPRARYGCRTNFLRGAPEVLFDTPGGTGWSDMMRLIKTPEMPVCIPRSLLRQIVYRYNSRGLSALVIVCHECFVCIAY